MDWMLAFPAAIDFGRVDRIPGQVDASLLASLPDPVQQLLFPEGPVQPKALLTSGRVPVSGRSADELWEGHIPVQSVTLRRVFHQDAIR